MLTGPRLNEDHVLDDGTRVVVRHIRPEDEPELQRGFSRLSASSRYRRFQGVVNELTPRTLHYLTHVDGKDHVALVATTLPDAAGKTTGLGVARFVREQADPTRAEVALIVADASQHKGLGRILAVAIARAARERGIRRFKGPILRDNVPIRRLLDEVGATFRPTTDGLEFEIDLCADDSGHASHLEELARQLLRAFRATVSEAPPRGAETHPSR